jgi:Bacteriophage related domain of unknown function
MSTLAAIRAALETKLATITGPEYAWENTPYVPTTGTPFVQVTLLPAQPANIEIGPGYTEQGLFQASGFWPKDSGAAAITAWAEQVRAAFPFRSSFVNAGVTVIITGTPEIGPARPDADRVMVPVKVNWQARIPS